jgi:hypothetical protein
MWAFSAISNALSVVPGETPQKSARRVRYIARMSNDSQPTTSPSEAGFIDEMELLNRLPVSRRTLFAWRESGKIPSVRLPGSRRILYHWASVEASLLRQQRINAQ